ncbi:MAG: hypothetical protein MRY78_05135 [Saprospiraceae bacterium]|nr:hypothetical protein [Saprospiraceae bacterium]
MSEFRQVVKDGFGTVLGWIKKFFITISILAVVSAGVYLWVCNWTYSEGTRAGYLIKISRKGVVFKTYEGQLNLGGFQSDESSGLAGNIWNFSVYQDDIYEQLQESEGNKVVLHYRQKYKAMPWQGKTDYFVYKITAAKGQNK